MTDAISKLTKAVKELDGAKEGDFEKNHRDTFTKEVYKNANASNQDETVEFVCAAITAGASTPLEWAIKLVEKNKAINFKVKAELGNKILAAFRDVDNNGGSLNSRKLGNLFEAFAKTLKLQKVIQKYEDKFVEIFIKGIESKQSHLHKCCSRATENIMFNNNMKLTQKVLDAIMKAIEGDTIYARDEQGYAITTVLLYLMRSYLSTPVVKNLAKPLSKIFHYCVDKDYEDPHDDKRKTIYWALLDEILDSYLSHARDHMDVIEPMYADNEKLRECGDAQLEEKANGLRKFLSGDKIAKLGQKSDVEESIQNYLNDGDAEEANQFQSFYPKFIDVFTPHMDAIAEKSFGCTSWEESMISMFFHSVSMSHVKNVTAKMVERMAALLISDNAKWSAVPFISDVAKHNVRLVEPHADTILEAIRADPITAGALGETISALAKAGDKKKAKTYCEFLKEFVDKTPEVQRVHLLLAFKEISTKHPDVVLPYKDFIKKQAEKGSPMVKQHCKVVIDHLEDRTLMKLDKSIKKHDDDIDDLDEKVTNTEENVETLGKDVDQTKEKVKDTKKDVTRVEGRVDEVEETVEETMKRVEELEKKTLSHAPEWASDICTLLNPESTKDWRLLAEKLGFKKEDITLWSGLTDPCKFLLDEWFNEHKTLQATKDVLKVLKDMGRKDAADIVEKALKAVEDIIREQPTDYSNPPPIFISYQWGLQEEVRLLKHHLQDAGYPGWMDIGQMGGGEKLYENIDQGIRGAKIIISCVSNKYAESPNCNREVNLGVNLKKPIIPLLMEKMSWPPPGGMGPIFSEFLFIRFFTRSGEETGDKRFWSAEKFQELLGQLRYIIAPDQKLVSKQYKGWWEPNTDDLIIPTLTKPKDKKEKQLVTVKGDVNPSIFISYQWDKQPQIKALYNALTKEGYHCWLDINQMSGGDSLYDKIDAGIRKCKIFVSCVTKNYAISANCRREVSLASSVKTSIIPLLLEKMSWPPEGPMADAFTRLVFINCYKPDEQIQNNWKGQQFDKLMAKIKKTVPKPDLVLPSVENDNKSTKEPTKTTEDKSAKSVDKGPTQQSEKEPPVNNDKTDSNKAENAVTSTGSVAETDSGKNSTTPSTEDQRIVTNEKMDSGKVEKNTVSSKGRTVVKNTEAKNKPLVSSKGNAVVNDETGNERNTTTPSSIQLADKSENTSSVTSGYKPKGKSQKRNARQSASCILF